MLNKNMKMKMNVNSVNPVNQVNQANQANQVNPVNQAKYTIWEINTTITQISEQSIVEPIILITQFYISSNSNRQKEIVDCLIYNLNNPFINIIYLISEKDYNLNQIGLPENVNNSKIKIININARMKYSDAFNIVSQFNLKGYIIIANSDIFFDSTLE